MRNAVQQYFTARPATGYTIAAILLLPALLIHLGLMPVTADEPTRAVVSLEMILGENWLVPTINGHPYLNKPPLYNWLLAVIFNISGSATESVIRLPVIVSVIIFAVVIWLFARKRTGDRVALVAGLAFVTGGRILFYDSMLGLIDIPYALVTFVSFICIYEFSMRRNYLVLFISSWALAATGFLMKGLPSVLFQALTLTAFLAAEKKAGKLLSVQHLAGLGLFILILASYYIPLSMHAPLGQYIGRLWSESAGRTPLEQGRGPTLLHLLTFPFKQLWYLAPWSLLILSFFRKKAVRGIFRDPFTRFLALTFLVNIPVYWISPGSHPRYLFMLYPLLCILLVKAYHDAKQAGSQTVSLVRSILLFAGGFTAAALGLLPFLEKTGKTDHLLWISLPAFIISAILVMLFKLDRKNDLVHLASLLLAFRVVFNLVVLPVRYHESREVLQKEQALTVAGITLGKELYFARHCTISHETTYYIERERREILRSHSMETGRDKYFIRVDKDPLKKNEKVIYEFETRWKRTPLRLVQFLP